MLTDMPQGLRSSELYKYIMQYLAINTGKIVTPSLITTTINKCLGVTFTTNKTVSSYLVKIRDAGLLYELDREYISLSDKQPSKLSYNRTYYFANIDSFVKFYDYASKDLFKHKDINGLSYDIAIAKTLLYHRCVNAGYDVNSGVLSFYSHLEGGKTKKNTLSFDFILKNGEKEAYVVFQNDKDFDEVEFTIEAKFALQNIINKLSVVVVTTASNFKPLEIEGFRYISLDEILTDNFNI